MVKSQVIYKDYSKDAERTALISGENLSHMFGKLPDGIQIYHG